MYYYFIFFHNYQWDTQRYDHPSQRFEGRISIIPIHILLYVQKPFLICWCRQREKKCIQGLRFRQHISISHLLSVDDSLNFYRASIKDCQHLKDIFYCYVVASGRIFNFDKSCIFFSGNVYENQISAIKRIFQLNVISKHEKYLSLPTMTGRKKIVFNEIKLKVQSKISSRQ